MKDQNKEGKTDIDQILQSQTKDSAVSLRPAKMQYEVLRLMLQNQN